MERIYIPRNCIQLLQDPSRLVKRAKDFLEEYRGTRELLAVHHTTSLAQNWEPPVGLNYKVNFDAAVFAEEEASGVGVVVRNNKGEAMASLSAKGPPVQDSEEAEALACRRAMEFVVEAGFMDVVLEGDNSTVLKAINSFKHSGSRLGHIYEDIQCIAASPRSFEVSLVKRCANNVAHMLAKYARQVEDEVVWLEVDPQPVVDALYADTLYLDN